MEKKLEHITKGMNLEKIKANWQEIISELGCCPLSQSDTLELMQNGDCMCLSLQIGRSQATIQDPTKLVIQGIVPTFMSLDSFLDSSIFKLKQNSSAAGDFDYNMQSELALGLGRESVSGVLPLFLF